MPIPSIPSIAATRARYAWRVAQWCALVCVSVAAQAQPAARPTAPPVAPMAAPKAAAQSATTAASTLWYEVTLGGAGARLSCDLCQSAWDTGPTISAAVGAYASPRLRIGLEASRWSHKDPAVREQLHGLGLVAHLIPNPRRGLYVVGGLGWTGYRAGAFSYDAPRVTIGLGWDLPMTGKWVVGNVVTFDASSFAPLKNGDVNVVDNVGLGAARFAVQVRRR